MSVELTLLDYNLTLLPQPPGDGAAVLEVGTEELAQMMSDPVMSIDTQRAVSVQDQLSLIIRPPNLTIVDHKGTAPARSEMVRTTVAVVEMLVARGFLPQPYGWNVQGVVNGVEPLEALRHLTAAQQISDALGDGSATWSVPQLAISVSSAIADRLTVALQAGADSEGRATLMFNANAHNERAPDGRHLHDEAANIWSATCDTISRLVG